MMGSDRSRALLAVLADPAKAQALDSGAWSDLVAAARASNLLGRLAERLHRAGVALAPRIQRHLDGARQLAVRQRLSVTWEAHCLQRALGASGVPVVLLKGAAYVLGGHRVADGRMFGDIDILVPREALGAVESALLLDGWVSAKAEAYDQRYYREWMHELPPMVHLRRGTVIDVHHTILPPTARRKPDPARIIRRARPLGGELPDVRVPAPEDLLTHSITHLVHEGELHNGLRDLVDIDTMVRHFGAEPGFLDRFAGTAIELDLAGPVAFGLRLAQRILATPVPPHLLQVLAAAAQDGAVDPWLDKVYAHGLLQHARAVTPSTAEALASALVYIRAHWLRMPPLLLARHLATKAWRGLQGDDARTPSGGVEPPPAKGV
jgi:hypothetical protein